MERIMEVKSRKTLLSGLEAELNSRGDMPEVGLSLLPKLNAKIWGLPKGLTIVAGRTSQGKTAFATQIALDMCLQGINTLYLSLEDTEISIIERMFNSLYNVSNFDLMRGFYKRSESCHKLFLEFKEKFANYPITITCGLGKSLHEVNMFVEHLPEKPKVVILDYIQNIRSGERERESLSEYIRKFREVMILNDLRGVVCSQITRNVEKQNQKDYKPTLEGLKGTGSLEESAELAILCYWDFWYTHEEDKKNSFDLLIAKNKKGATGYHSLKFLPEYYKFIEKDEDENIKIPESKAEEADRHFNFYQS